MLTTPGANSPSGDQNFTNKNRDITLESIENIVNSLLNPTGKNILVGTTGSSGRCEEYSKLDDLELLLYSGNEVPPEDVILLEDAISNFSGKCCTIMFERKDRKKPEYFEGASDKSLDKPLFFPSRFIDFLQIHGSEDQYNDLVDTFIGNIQTSERKKIDDWKKRIATHKRVSNSGVIKWQKKDYKIFDEQERIINYSKEPDGIEISIKIGALRYIQYQIVQLIMVLVRANKIGREDFISIGKGIDEKIDFLGDFGLEASFVELQELKGLYAFFLGIHNRISSDFNKQGSGEVSLSDDEFNLFQKNLSDFNTLMEKFKIKN